MRIGKKLTACVLILLFLLSGCSASQSARKTEFFAMDTVMTLTAYGSHAEKGLTDAEKEINRIAGLFEHGTVSAEAEDGELAELSARALKIAADTDGAFDPTVTELMEAWGFYEDTQRVPDQAEIDAILEKTGYEKVTADTVLDLGGIGKGYAAGKAKEALLEDGVETGVLSLGGNVSVFGKKPDGSEIIVGIMDPESPDSICGTLTVTDRAVVTSGQYERCFEENGVVYGHILDPETGYPVDNTLLSATVITDDDVLADALSTALFVMGEEKAEAFYRSGVYDFEMILIRKGRTCLVTSGIADRFQTTLDTTVIEP